MSKKRLALGEKGEEFAVKHLQKKGYRILERNYRCRAGELDIIAAAKDTVIFVEVRSRSSNKFGDPLESIGPAKQKKVRELALIYLKNKNLPGLKVRFDVIGAYLSTNGKLLSLEHIKDAF